jgi:hypothetical protein
MDCKPLLACITGSVEQHKHILLRNEYPAADNILFRNQITGRLYLSDAEGITLAEIDKKLGKQALEEVTKAAKLDTILAWHRKEEGGSLKAGRCLIHGRNTKFCGAFKQRLDDAGVNRLPLSHRSPNLNAFAERFARSFKEEALSRFILFGEKSLHYVLKEYVAHCHEERLHQSKGKVILFPTAHPTPSQEAPIHCRERLGGTLKFYDRKAA